MSASANADVDGWGYGHPGRRQPVLLLDAATPPSASDIAERAGVTHARSSVRRQQRRGLPRRTQARRGCPGRQRPQATQSARKRTPHSAEGLEAPGPRPCPPARGGRRSGAAHHCRTAGRFDQRLIELANRHPRPSGRRRTSTRASWSPALGLLPRLEFVVQARMRPSGLQDMDEAQLVEGLEPQHLEAPRARRRS